MYDINRSIKKSRDVLTRQHYNRPEWEPLDFRTTAAVARTERRLRRMNATLDNVAGSVGRTAPRIRDVQNHVQKMAQKTVNIQTSDAFRSAVTQGKSESNTYTFPPVEPTSTTVSFPNIRVAVIADEFTARAFGQEWNTVEPTPHNWREVLDRHGPNFLFVESGWEANDGSWKYYLVGATAPRPAIVELVNYCRSIGIPTVFWNKEDPPHFEDFLPTAALFDYVFTTDGNLIAEYKKRLGHNRIYVLPFAAQERIHNPARVKDLKRERDVVFGGMYFREKYPERRGQLDTILPAAARFNLDIYSRQKGTKIEYRYPDEYIGNVRGSLPYTQMLAAYHVYKTVINVNSVTNSETMCARRIFEATACGAAVITESSPAIRNFFPENLLGEVATTEDTYHQIRALVRSDEYRQRRVHAAQRHIWENHTYKHRAEEVMSALMLEYESSPDLHSFFITTNRPENLEEVFKNVSRQTLDNKELVILTHGFKPDILHKENLAAKYRITNIRWLDSSIESPLGENLNRLTAACQGNILFRMDDDDYYGPKYAQDLKYALRFSGADLVGKAATYIYFEDFNSTVLTYEAHEHRFTNFIRGATFCGPKRTFMEYQFPEVARSEDSSFISQVMQGGGRIYASDRFGFMVMRRREKISHTWQVDDYQLFSSGVMKFVGNDVSQVDV